jgi:hypothetical protein
VNWADAVPMLDDDESPDVPLLGLAAALPLPAGAAAIPSDSESATDFVPGQSSATTPGFMPDSNWPSTLAPPPSVLRSALPIVVILFAVAAGAAVVRRGWRRGR